MEKKFLGCVFAAILLVIAAGFLWAIAGQRLLRGAMVPSVDFAESPQAPAPDYASAASWVSRPGLSDDPARFAPAGYAVPPRPAAAAFYVSGTTYLQRDRWNAPLDDETANRLQADLVRAQASTLNGAAEVWSPRYRQATFGSFLAQQDPRARQAFDLAYRDVAAAFDTFVAAQPTDRPLILMGHSQGGLHLMRLLRDRVAGKPLSKRIAAAYVLGWPISTTADLPRLGLPACTGPARPGCILSWQSFASDGDPKELLAAFEAEPGLAGTPRRGTAMLCTNPLTGGAKPAAPPAANIGTLLNDGTMVASGPGAACDARGVLRLAGEIPDVGPAVLPGGNYHVYDVQLFWANVRADAEARLNAWGAANVPAGALAETEQ